jgi:hypothetical protein
VGGRSGKLRGSDGGTRGASQELDGRRPMALSHEEEGNRGRWMGRGRVSPVQVVSTESEETRWRRRWGIEGIEGVRVVSWPWVFFLTGEGPRRIQKLRYFSAVGIQITQRTS